MFEDDEIEDFDQFEDEDLEFFDENDNDDDEEEEAAAVENDEEDISEKTIDEIVSEIIINIELLEAILLDVIETNERLRKELEKYRGEQNDNDNEN